MQSRPTLMPVILAGLVAAGGLTAPPARAADPDLILWLKFDETSGLVAADASGKGNDGTVVTGASGPQWVTGHRGRALEFDELAGAYVRRVQVPWDASLTVTNKLTTTAWINLRNFDKTEQSIVGRCANTDWRLETRGKNRRITFVVDTGSRATLNAFALAGSFEPGNWYHVAATYDGSQMRIFLNSVELANRACSGDVQTNASTAIPLGIGAFPSNATKWEDDFPGVIDEVKVWKRALTAAEIQTDMNAGATLSRLRWRESF